MIADDLRHYLQECRDSVVGSLEGLSEFDVRRPLVPSGTNLLGLVKHLTGIEFGYLGASSGRPAPLLPWVEDGSIWQNGDMWAKPDESREYLLDLYRAAWQHSDASIAELPLDAPASVPWWPEHRRTTTFGHLLARVTAETAQHAGHCDVVRELIDGRSGADNPEGYYDLVLSMASAPTTGPGADRTDAAFPVES
ncbi:DinB family protein [Lentzea sp. JNUCC 0626]|uniref:DinB family protein n=1 Tax=Lentzea sp. JNUCC 0626 TaxID=3367513 RepID=UPI003749AD28